MFECLCPSIAGLKVIHKCNFCLTFSFKSVIVIQAWSNILITIVFMTQMRILQRRKLPKLMSKA
jgi:hypothetical protein